MTTDTTTDRVFLDASILFSVGQAESGLSQLWELADKGLCELLASRYVIEKAMRNLHCFEELKTLENCLTSIQVVPESDVRLRCPIKLHKRARAVLMAAIAAKSDYLLTVDNEFLEISQGEMIMDVKIITARDYLLRAPSLNRVHLERQSQP